jgi:hypothetical protein
MKSMDLAETSVSTNLWNISPEMQSTDLLVLWLCSSLQQSEL